MKSRTDMRVLNSIKRIEKGQFYWVPETGAVGAFKVRESLSTYDDGMYENGRYFGSYEDALSFSVKNFCRRLIRLGTWMDFPAKPVGYCHLPEWAKKQMKRLRVAAFGG